MSPRDFAVAQRDDGDLQATAAMCYHCFDVLVKEVATAANTTPKGVMHNLFKSEKSTTETDDTAVSATTAVAAADLPNEECPIFITWDKRRHRTTPFRKSSSPSSLQSHYELRGCIGTLSPKPLVSSVGRYALMSALNDRRFHPVTTSEIPYLRVAVSLLIKYEDCEHCYDWIVGVHGIMIQWDDNHRRHFSATYLPEVAKEQGWDQPTTVTSLIRKAGYQGSVTEDLIKRIHCRRYQSSKYRMTYDEYVEYLGNDPIRSRTFPEHGDVQAAPSNCSVM